MADKSFFDALEKLEADAAVEAGSEDEAEWERLFRGIDVSDSEEIQQIPEDELDETEDFDDDENDPEAEQDEPDEPDEPEDQPDVFRQPERGES